MTLSRKVAPYPTCSGGAEPSGNIMPITNPLETLIAEVKRRTDVTCAVGALLLDLSDERQLQRRYMQLEGLQFSSNTQPVRLSAFVT